MPETWTSLKLIQWTSKFFKKKGIPNPRLDAELLLAHTLKCRRIDLYTGHEKKIPEKELARFRALVERRAKREPLQYIVGETEFWGLKIKITPDVLIPRPETELLVEEIIKIVGANPCVRPQEEGQTQGSAPTNIRILEIGTGSGCIAIALAKNLPSARIVATDISPEALEIAHGNAKHNGVDGRIELILSDIASIIPGGRYADFPPGPPRSVRSRGVNPTLAHGTFDLIVSNPPYIATDEFPSLQPEVRDFEPRKALDGGPGGLEILQKILREAPPFLKKGGHLLAEIGEGQTAPLRALLAENPSFEPPAFKMDLAGTDRIIVLKRR